MQHSCAFVYGYGLKLLCPGPEKVLDVLRCELVCEDMLAVQEAFKGLEVSWCSWATFL